MPFTSEEIKELQQLDAEIQRVVGVVDSINDGIDDGDYALPDDEVHDCLDRARDELVDAMRVIGGLLQE